MHRKRHTASMLPVPRALVASRDRARLPTLVVLVANGLACRGAATDVPARPDPAPTRSAIASRDASSVVAPAIVENASAISSTALGMAEPDAPVVAAPVVAKTAVSCKGPKPSYIPPTPKAIAVGGY